MSKKKIDMLEYKQTIINNNPHISFTDIDTELLTTQSKITYVCKEHGQLSKRALELYKGKGCSKCLLKVTGTNKTMTTEQFIQKSNEKHDNKYDYSKTVYQGSQKKVTIICPIHGEFEQLAVAHMTRGVGCRHCGFITSATNSYIKVTEAGTMFATLYYIKCYGKNETFYKIGVTKNNVNTRYNTTEAMPYLFEVLREIRGNADKILEIEESIKRDIKPYTPQIPFAGSVTECTENEINLNQYLV